MSAEKWRRRILGDLALPKPKSEAVPGREPEPVAALAPPRYVAVYDKDGFLVPVGSITATEALAWRDADWWSANDTPGAFVCELRRVTR